MNFASFFQTALVTGIVTFLHEVKQELIDGTLNKQTATGNAVDSLLVAAVAGADALATSAATSATTPQSPVSANSASFPSQAPQTTSSTVIASKTASGASGSGDTSPQS